MSAERARCRCNSGLPPGSDSVAGVIGFCQTAGSTAAGLRLQRFFPGGCQGSRAAWGGQILLWRCARASRVHRLAVQLREFMQGHKWHETAADVALPRLAVSLVHMWCTRTAAAACQRSSLHLVAQTSKSHSCSLASAGHSRLPDLLGWWRSGVGWLQRLPGSLVLLGSRAGSGLQAALRRWVLGQDSATLCHGARCTHLGTPRRSGRWRLQRAGSLQLRLQAGCSTGRGEAASQGAPWQARRLSICLPASSCSSARGGARL